MTVSSIGQKMLDTSPEAQMTLLHNAATVSRDEQPLMKWERGAAYIAEAGDGS